MTAQEHLARIRNLIAKVEELEKEAMDEPWYFMTETISTIPLHYVAHGPGLNIATDLNSINADFIALNRNIIVPLLGLAKIALTAAIYSSSDYQMNAILSLLPDELLTLCGV